MTSIRVHYMKLPSASSSSEKTNDDEWKWERLRREWIIINSNNNSNQNSDTEENDKVPSSDDTTSDSLSTCFRLQVGDLLCFPELFTGAGEMEGVRMVVDTTKPERTTHASAATRQQDHDERYLLSKCGIEYPLFPRAIQELAHSRHCSLRDLYEEPLNYILQNTLHNNITLDDIFGGSANAFWENPDIARTSPSWTDRPVWYIPLSDLVWETTVEFTCQQSGSSSHDE